MREPDPRFRPLTADDLERFRLLVGVENVLTASEELAKYSRDMTEDLVFPPEVAVRPRNTAEVSRVLAYCNEHGLPVTPQSRHTCLSGGALPVLGGVALSVELLNRIVHVDTQNFQVTVEPFVLNYDLRQAVEAQGLFYPPDPASYRICSLGGNLAEGSGGPKCVKYGTTKDYVLNLEVVLADGRVLWTGANTLKNVTGYNLTQLFVGSEGTLGVITKAVLRLIPKPRCERLMLVSFSDLADSVAAVNTVLGAGLIPSALEFMERNALLAARAYAKTDFPEVRPTTQAHLIIEFDGADAELLERDAGRTEALLRAAFPSVEYVEHPADEAVKERLWKLRRSVLVAAKAQSHVKEEDIVVPRTRLPGVVELLGRLKSTYDLEFIAWGHAGDGNLHVCILQGTRTRDEFEAVCEPYLEEFFQTVCGRLGGTVTGEHGVGWVQRKAMAANVDSVALEVMRALKRTLDPRGILNPGKIFLAGS